MEVSQGKVLFIGPDATHMAPLLPPSYPHATAPSFLEAILSPSTDHTLILADIAGEMDHLESGIRNLRRMNAGARIVLLCEPMNEATCRRAMHWGADDYEILPLEAASMEVFCDHHQAVARKRALSRLLVPTPIADHAPLMLPMAVQTTLMEEIFEGGDRADFASRAVGSVVKMLHLKGTLVYVPEEAATPPISPRELRQKVTFPGQPPFGTLIWQTDAFAPADPDVLGQAASWLAALLAVSRRYEQLRTMAITDELSGAYNRRYFLPKLTMVLKEAADNHSHVTLLLFDIDNFKRYNDTFGHAAGDAIIRELIKILHACTRPYDLVARVGGDEFAVVYRDNEAPRQPNSEHPKDVLAATERFREAIRNHQWPETCNIKGTISISGGLATFPEDATTIEQLLAKADGALLQAKDGGKNVIVLTGKQRTGVAT